MRFRNIARRNKVAYDFNDCNPLTDAEGREGKAWWYTNIRRDTKNGGPVFWIHETYRCKEPCGKYASLAEADKPHCCRNVPEGRFCRPDSDKMEDDPNVSSFQCF